MARRQNRRCKPKKKPNRYNPNRPDWAAVHMPGWQRGVASFLSGVPLVSLPQPAVGG